MPFQVRPDNIRKISCIVLVLRKRLAVPGFCANLPNFPIRTGSPYRWEIFRSSSLVASALRTPFSVFTEIKPTQRRSHNDRKIAYRALFNRNTTLIIKEITDTDQFAPLSQQVLRSQPNQNSTICVVTHFISITYLGERDDGLKAFKPHFSNLQLRCIARNRIAYYD